MQLVEEAVDGCWIGHRARTAILGDSGIGSVYSPPQEDQDPLLAPRRIPVETVIDIGHRPQVKQLLYLLWSLVVECRAYQGWILKCEKGGIRRVLMNLFGNSLKFTAVCLETFDLFHFLTTLKEWFCPCYASRVTPSRGRPP